MSLQFPVDFVTRHLRSPLMIEYSRLHPYLYPPRVPRPRSYQLPWSPIPPEADLRSWGKERTQRGFAPPHAPMGGMGKAKLARDASTLPSPGKSFSCTSSEIPVTHFSGSPGVFWQCTTEFHRRPPLSPSGGQDRPATECDNSVRFQKA